MYDSFLPLGGAVLFANMMVDEVIIGAPGICGMLLFCFVSVFVAGLMIGTPEYGGKKIETPEIKMTILAIAAGKKVRMRDEV